MTETVNVQTSELVLAESQVTDTVVVEQPSEAVVVPDNVPVVVVTGLLGPAGRDGVNGVQGNTGPQGPPGQDGSGANTISQLTDVNLTNLQNGSLLVYNNPTQKWVAQRDLDNQILEAGQF